MMCRTHQSHKVGTVVPDAGVREDALTRSPRSKPPALAGMVLGRCILCTGRNELVSHRGRGSRMKRKADSPRSGVREGHAGRR